MSTSQRATSCLALGLAGALLLTAAAKADEAAEYANLLDQRGGAIVTIKFVLRTQTPFGENENESEISGLMIDPQGLVLCSNTQLGGFLAMLKQVMGAMMGEATATPTDLKVLIGDDTEGVEAKLLARDTELDLAWVQLKEAPEKKLDFVSLTEAAKPALGQRVLAIRRLGKHFDRATVVADGRIGGQTTKPRKLYIPTGGLAGGVGAPVFTADGQFVGLTIMQMPEAEEAADNPMAMFGRMSSMQDTASGFILPAEEVAKATQRAKETASE
jgi:S1-C subfamily serine protease